MALNLDSVGKSWGPYEYSYTERDLIIYALGIGFTKDNLEYVYEGSKNFKSFPTYGVIVPANGRGRSLSLHEGQFCHGCPRRAGPGSS